MLSYTQLDETSQLGVEKMMVREGTHSTYFDQVKTGELCVSCLETQDKCRCGDGDQ